MDALWTEQVNVLLLECEACDALNPVRSDSLMLDCECCVVQCQRCGTAAMARSLLGACGEG